MMRQVIKRAQVYGMRCSGTNYLDALIRKNFPNLFVCAATPSVRRMFGWKHGDVGAKTYLHYKGSLHDIKIMPLDWAESRDTLLLVVYRNPMSYLQSLHRAPHQSPESYGLSFSEFIQKPFRAFHCNPPGSEYSPIKSIRMRQINEKRLVEEYDSVFTMRQSKISIFGSFRYRFQNVVYVNLETLEQDPESFIRSVAMKYGLTMGNKFEDVTTYKGGAAPYIKSIYNPINSKDLLYILTNADWPSEESIGYVPRFGARLLTSQAGSQQEPDTLLNIFSYIRMYHKGRLY